MSEIEMLQSVNQGDLINATDGVTMQALENKQSVIHSSRQPMITINALKIRNPNSSQQIHFTQ